MEQSKLGPAVGRGADLRSRGRLPAEQSDELARAENVALDAVGECWLRHPSGQIQYSVQREGCEVVVVRGARRRTRSAVAVVVEVVTALARAIRQLLSQWHRPRQGNRRR